MMSTDANAAVPFASKNLGDLSKNNAEVNELLYAILWAVEVAEAHKATGRKQSVSLSIFSPLYLFSSLALTLLVIVYLF